jgi:hypothetical protein
VKIAPLPKSNLIYVCFRLIVFEINILLYFVFIVIIMLAVILNREKRINCRKNLVKWIVHVE